MSDPVARPHKRLVTLIGAGIAAMLSPSGKIISSAAAAGLIVAAVATQVATAPAPKAKVVTPPTTEFSPYATTYVPIETAAGDVVPVMMSDRPAEDDLSNHAAAGSVFASVIPPIHIAAVQPMSVAPTPLPSAPPAAGPGPGPTIILAMPEPPDIPPVFSPEPEPKPAPEPNDPPESPIPPELPPVFPPVTPPAGPGGPFDPLPKGPQGPEAPPGGERPPSEVADPTTTPSLAITPLAVAAVPEPGVLGLVLLGLGGLAWTARRRSTGRNDSKA